MRVVHGTGVLSRVVSRVLRLPRPSADADLLRRVAAARDRAVRHQRFHLVDSVPADLARCVAPIQDRIMIRRLSSGQYRLYSRKKDPKTGRRSNLGTFGSRAAAEKHERAVQFFKRH